MKRLNINIDDFLFLKFKKKCVSKQESMSDIIRKFILVYTSSELKIIRSQSPNKKNKKNALEYKNKNKYKECISR